MKVHKRILKRSMATEYIFVILLIVVLLFVAFVIVGKYSKALNKNTQSVINTSTSTISNLSSNIKETINGI